MVLSDASIKKLLKEGAIGIDPPPSSDQYASSALDLRLGNEFHRYKPQLVGQQGVDVVIRFGQFDYKRLAGEYIEKVPLDSNGGVVLKPGDFRLCTTAEKITLPRRSNVAARVEGRSTLARLGLTVHVTAPTIHAGWLGVITLEIKNVGDLQVFLKPGDRICQLIFEVVEGNPETALNSIFQDQKTPLGK